MQVKKKGQTCAEGLKINPFAQVCPLKQTMRINVSPMPVDFSLFS